MDSNKSAIEAGADLFMPKPMTRSHLLTIILESLPAQQVVDGDEPNHLIVVDDCRFQRYHWANLKSLKEDVKTFESPEEFLAAVQKDPLVMKGAKGIITDYYFDGVSSYSGLEFAKVLRKMGYHRKVYLCSDGEFDEESFKSANVLKIPKIASSAVNYL